MNTRTKKTNIPMDVKQVVFERDQECCIFCGKHLTVSFACVHVIPRSSGGLGIKENIVTGCSDCHIKLDHSSKRSMMLMIAHIHLFSFYPDYDYDQCVYHKGVTK